MISKKSIFTIIYILIFSSNVSFGLYIKGLHTNVHDKKLDKKLGKQISSFAETANGVIAERWYYTTKLSRLLLVGEPEIFESVRWWPIVDTIALVGPLFDNRFNHFIENVGKVSQEQLKEAIQDAILLSSYSSNGYQPSTLLDGLIKVLQHTIFDIREQVKHNYRWHHKSMSDLKKSLALFAGLMTVVVIANKTGKDNQKGKKTSSALEAFGALATLGCIPVSYKALKDCYKVLTIDPNDCNQFLKQYEELLLFVQSLQLQLKKNGCLVFKLPTGYTATVNDKALTFDKDE